MNRLNPKATRHTESRYNFVAPFYNLMEWVPDKVAYNGWRKDLWSLVKGGQVLEIGVGTGLNIPHHPKGAEVTGIDLSEKMLAQARKASKDHRGKDPDLQIMDAQAMNFEDDTFDSAAATFVFCSVPDPVLGLKEALRVTKPGGKLYLLEHMRAEAAALGWLMDRLDGLVHWLLGFHIARETVENVRRAGWEIESITDLTPFSIYRLIVARKAG